MKEYTTPEIVFNPIEYADIITTSGGDSPMVDFMEW